MNLLENKFSDGVFVVAGTTAVGAICAIGAVGVVSGGLMIMTNTAPKTGWVKSQDIKECISPGRSIGGTVATGLGHKAIGTPEKSCFKVTPDGRVYFEERG